MTIKNIYTMKIISLLCFFVLSGFSGCDDGPPSPSPPGYDLHAPVKFIMSESLREISGITFLHDNSDTMYAIEDEDGKLFYFHLGDGKFNYRKFGKHGDYEDVTIMGGNTFVVLRSDGSLFVFPPGLVQDGNMQQVEVYENILPQGEYEGLYGDDNGDLLALCKNCPNDEQHNEVSVYRLRTDKKGRLAITDHFEVDVSGIDRADEKRRSKFHPSCLARHPLTREWYILSSVNKVLLVLDDKWRLKATYPLDPDLFKQPEGLTFDRKGNMYISNEGGQGNANVLLFRYKRP